ncbi:MAG: YbaN family protein [Gemmatimonadota bacterium]|nr:MAG: YbaN family protein [Gemmatimonadota bacterium]
MPHEIPNEPEETTGPGPRSARPVVLTGPARWLLIGVGLTCVGLGAVGTVLPLLPTTPFLLVAAACFARSSPRFYRWLLNRPGVGPAIQEWRDTRTIPRPAKAVAILSIVLVGGSSIVFFVGNPWAKLIMGVGLLSVIGWLLTIPARSSRNDSDRPS